MKDNFTVQDMQEGLKTSSGYLIGVSFLNKGILTHHLLTNNFPTGDINIAMRELGKLATETLKTGETTNEPTK